MKVSRFARPVFHGRLLSPMMITRSISGSYKRNHFPDSLVRIPGLIDVHVHVRDPGETQKEDWASCTSAALAGGITMICAMPNTTPALCTADDYDLTNLIASSRAKCDFGLFVGASSTNTESAIHLSEQCAGLKLYLDATHGPLLLRNTGEWDKHLANWKSDHPICAHAEGVTLAALLHIAGVRKQAVHICHVARAEEIRLIRQAKEAGWPVTCEVAPHHLFLSAGSKNEMLHVMPNLQSKEDVKALWDNMDVIDCFATDHAPHLVAEKHTGCPGFPGLETALGLLLTSVHEGRLTLEDVVQRYHTNPKRIFSLPEQEDTFVEIDLSEEWTVGKGSQFSKCGWTPFEGRKLVGAVKKVVLRGETAYISEQAGIGEVLVAEGFGQNVRTFQDSQDFRVKEGEKAFLPTAIAPPLAGRIEAVI